MSALERLKAQIRAKNHTANYNNHNQTTNPLYNAQSNEIIVLPSKPKKKKKLMEVQKEHKQTINQIPSGMGNGKSVAYPSKPEEEMDDEEMNEDDDDENKPRHVPWGPAYLLKNLDKPEIVTNLDQVIDLIKKKEQEVPVTEEDRKRGARGEKKKEIIVWDHSKTSIGKQSDNNFFLWLQAYAAHEDKRCQQEENMIFQ